MPEAEEGNRTDDGKIVQVAFKCCMCKQMVQCGQVMEKETRRLCGQELHMLTSVACSENCCKSRGRRKGNSTDFLAAPDICVFATRNRKTFVNALRSRASPFRKADVLYFKKCKEKTWKMLVRKNLSSEILGAPMKKPQRNCGPSDSQPTIACT